MLIHTLSARLSYTQITSFTKLTSIKSFIVTRRCKVNYPEGTVATFYPDGIKKAKRFFFHIPFGIFAFTLVIYMKSFKPRSENTRQLIIEKAAVVFNKKGLEGTSLTDLTLATGLTKGSIYGNFENKNEVALEVFKYNFQQLGFRIRSFVSKAPDPINQLYALTKFYRADFEMMTYLGGCPILNAAADSDDTNPTLRKEVITAFQTVLFIISGIIRDGQNKRLIPVDLDADKYATVFFELLEGGVLLSKTMGDKQYLIDACDRIDLIIKRELAN